MLDARIIGVGCALPEKVVTSEELEEQIGFDRMNIRKGMARLLSGVCERRIAEADVNSSDLAAQAGLMAIERAGLKPSDIDLCIFAAVSQDLIEPATVNIAMDKMDIRNASGFDIKNACNSFINALDIAVTFIRSGKARNALVINGEVLSKYVRKKFDKPEDIKNVNSTFSVGDAGGAVLLGAFESDDNEPSIVAEFHSFPDTWLDGALLGGGTMYHDDPEKMYGQNESKEMIQKNFERSVDFYNEKLHKYNTDYSDVKLFIPPQITKYIVDKMTDEMGLPKEKVVCQVPYYGNISSATIPVALCKAIDDGILTIGSGEKVVCFGAANGFNAGFLSIKM